MCVECSGVWTWVDKNSFIFSFSLYVYLIHVHVHTPVFSVYHGIFIVLDIISFTIWLNDWLTANVPFDALYLWHCTLFCWSPTRRRQKLYCFSRTDFRSTLLSPWGLPLPNCHNLYNIAIHNAMVEKSHSVTNKKSCYPPFFYLPRLTDDDR